MFKVTKFRKHYINHAKELAVKNNKFDLPDLTSPLIVVRIAVKDEQDNLVGYGFLKIISEAILVLDNDNLNVDEKAEIVEQFYKVGSKAAKKKGFDEIDAFVTNNRKFVNFLLKKLDFKESGAEVLVKRL